MIEGVVGRVSCLVTDAKITAQALFEGRLVVKDSFLQSRMRIANLHQRNQEAYKAGVCLSEIEKDIARFHYLEPIHLLGMNRYFRDWLAIVPVWREGKPVPPLSYKGRSVRVYSD